MTRIKFCGLTRPQDVADACAAGAHALGLNLARGQRRIDLDHAAMLARLAPPPVMVVLLFVDAPTEAILAAVAATRAGCVQLHGDEPAEQAADLARRLPVIKAFAAGTPAATIRAYPCDVALVDAPRGPAGFGGTGDAWNHAALAGVDLGHPLMLAGGLTPATVANAVAAVRPWAVDVSSGIESAPGIKDADLMRAFVAAASQVPFGPNAIHTEERR
jgi:phosphoribosylanthranilate isomerase